MNLCEREIRRKVLMTLAESALAVTFLAELLHSVKIKL